MSQKLLITEWDNIAHICQECKKRIEPSEDILLISACFAEQKGRKSYLTLLPTGGFCSSTKSVCVTGGGRLLQCPEGNWSAP